MNRRPKVAMIIATYWPVWGGAQRQLAQIAKHLKDKGLEIFILTRRLKRTSKFEVIDGIPVYRIFVTNRFKVLDSVFFIFLSLIWLLRNKAKFDILHCYQIYSPATIGIMVKKILKNKKVFVKVTSSNEYGEANEIKKLPFCNLRVRLFKDVDKFFAVNYQIANELKSLGIAGSHIAYMPNGVAIPDKGSFELPGRKCSLKEELGINYEKIAIFTGRITQEKNLSALLLAWRGVIDVFPNMHLIILGEGGRERNEEAGVKGLIDKLRLKDSVHLLGKVHDVTDYLLASDIFVLPSISEGLSNSLLEAMACGLAIIASNNDGNKHLITDCENGLLADPNDPGDFSRALIKLINDDALRYRLAENARKTVKERFRMSDVAQKHMDAYGGAHD